ncbi:hypothetical protein NP493_445g04003 [Ridgeia piscesae]|uniref:Uncharacterized protein n=1 Tax=Ridgeia piscesae TaxID=27915 RepID=A0AAD9KZX5_RIDPI|nr:hypothetical protein NP493_445g04003 [Ridgeia piscesae]
MAKEHNTDITTDETVLSVLTLCLLPTEQLSTSDTKRRKPMSDFRRSGMGRIQKARSRTLKMTIVIEGRCRGVMGASVGAKERLREIDVRLHRVLDALLRYVGLMVV